MPAMQQGWWTGLGDPQLDRLVQEATTRSPTLALALARVRAAEAEVALARSGRLPQLTLDAEVSRERFSGSSTIPPPYAGASRTMGNIQADLNWNLDFWGKQGALMKRAERLAEARSLDATGARLAIAVAVVQAYVALERSYRLEALATRVEAQRRGIFDLIGRRVKSGLESDVEASHANARLAEARMDLLDAQAGREAASHALAALAGQGPAYAAALTHPKLQPSASFDLPDYLPADLLSRRPDILAARARIDAAVSGRAAARADFYPNVNLSAFAGWASLGLSDLLNSSSRTYGAGPALHLPLFDAGALKARYSLASADVETAVADYDAAVLQAVRQVADRLSAIRAIEAELAIQSEALASSQRVYDGTMVRYRSGLTGLLAVREAEAQLIAAEQRQVLLETERLSQRAGLMLALGGDTRPITETNAAGNRPGAL